jgi:hypothetical protein
MSPTATHDGTPSGVALAGDHDLPVRAKIPRKALSDLIARQRDRTAPKRTSARKRLLGHTDERFPQPASCVANLKPMSTLYLQAISGAIALPIQARQ